MLEIGSLVDGKYKILNVIGKGGMSVVYLAMNERANKQWAIKEIRKDGVQNYEVVRQGLIAETNLLKRLSHPNLPSIVDVIDDKDTFLIVMDYIEGIPLSQVLEEGKQPQEKVVDWALQLCSVLQYLHSQDNPIIYRDMKPSNVMLKPDGSVMLIDFGTARTFKHNRIEDTTCLGTVGYAAPEQFGGRGQTDARTDIYCLGATLYHLVTGQNPSEPPYEMYPITEWDSTLSTGLESIIWQCTQQNPDDRFQNCEELKFALEHYRELDIEYKKKQNKRLGLFMASCIISATAFILAGVSEYLYRDNLTSNYDIYLQNAGTEVEKEDMLKQYQKAIDLMPERGDAYDRILSDVILDDDVLTQEEAYTIRDILNANAQSGRPYEEYFMQNPEDYEKFAYKLGVAYFYSYEDKGNKSLSRKWLDIAAKAENLSESEIERAKRLGSIAGYYAKIGVENKSGDAGISYLDYWNDLILLTEGNLVEKDNATTALIMYKELVYQIYTNCMSFKKVGVSKEQMESQLQMIEQRLTSDFGNADLETNERVKNLHDNLTEYLQLTKEALEVTFADDVDEEQKDDENDNIGD